MRIMGMGVVVVLLSIGTGCATLRGDKQKVKFVTEPAGAVVVVDDKERVVTPAEVMLKRKDPHKIEVSKAGYRPITFKLESQWDGASMTDVALPGGSALMGLSLATGSDKAFRELRPIRLEKTSEASPAAMEVFQYRGKLYVKEEYERLWQEEAMDKTRFMGTSSD